MGRFTPKGGAPDSTDLIVGVDPDTLVPFTTLVSDLPAGGGSGDVTGAASSVNNELVLMSGTTGKVIKSATTTGIVKATSGVISAASAGTDYAPATSGSAVLKGNGAGGFSIAAAGTDYAAPTSGTYLLKGNGSGGFADASADYAAASHNHAASSITSGTIDTARLGSGTPSSTTFLRGDQTWAAATGSGQTLYECVVAASGGDYTTVGAAITAGKTRIFVRAGTYSETTMSLPSNCVIVGESRDGVILDLNNGYIACGGNDRLEHFTIKNWATNGVRVTTESLLNDLRFTATTSYYEYAIRFGSAYRFHIQNCIFDNATASVGAAWIRDSSAYGIAYIHNNTFTGNYQRAIQITQGSIFRFYDNYCQSTYASTGTCGLVDVNFAGTLHDCTITGNYLATSTGAATNHRGVYIQNASQMSVRNNNISVHTGFGVGVDLVAADYTLVTDNFVVSGAIGIQTDASTDRALLSGNHLYAATTPITDNGTNTLKTGLNMVA